MLHIASWHEVEPNNCEGACFPPSLARLLGKHGLSGKSFSTVTRGRNQGHGREANSICLKIDCVMAKVKTVESKNLTLSGNIPSSIWVLPRVVFGRVWSTWQSQTFVSKTHR